MNDKQAQRDMLTQLGWDGGLIDAFLESDVALTIRASVQDDQLTSSLVDLQNVVIELAAPTIVSGKLIPA